MKKKKRGNRRKQKFRYGVKTVTALKNTLKNQGTKKKAEATGEQLK